DPRHPAPSPSPDAFRRAPRPAYLVHQNLRQTSQERGLEGIACVDDTPRATVLALQEYQHTECAAALRLAPDWLSFIEYMQGPDGRFANCIFDEASRKNLRGQDIAHPR